MWNPALTWCCDQTRWLTADGHFSRDSMLWLKGFPQPSRPCPPALLHPALSAHTTAPQVLPGSLSLGILAWHPHPHVSAAWHSFVLFSVSLNKHLPDRHWMPAEIPALWKRGCTEIRTGSCLQGAHSLPEIGALFCMWPSPRWQVCWGQGVSLLTFIC